MVLPSPLFMMVGYALGAFLVCLGAILFRSNVRVAGAPTWLLLAMLNIDYALPVAGICVLMGVVLIHWILPSLLPDFQTSNMGVSCVLAGMLGLAVIVSGIISGEFVSLFPFDDPSRVMDAPGHTPGSTLQEDEALERLLR